jgi:hypothetical protein
MAYCGSNCRTWAIALFCCATASIAGSSTALAQPWSWFFRGPAVRSAYAPAAPAAFPVPTIKRATKSHLQPVLRETSAQDIRHTLDTSREFSAIAERLSVEAALQLDPTLRRGDIAVTSTGLHVFHGPRASFHRASEFQPLAKSSLAARADLRAIQVAGQYALPTAATRTAFIDVLTIRPARKIVEVRARDTVKHGFHVIDIPRMR